MHQLPRRALVRALLLCSFACALSPLAAAQSPSPNTNDLGNNLFGNETVERRLREQREEIDALRALVEEQTRLVRELKERVEHAEQLAATLTTQPARAAVVADASYTAAPSSTVAPSTAEAANQTTTKPNAATANNNATNRDGRLSSGYNLVDLIARLELKHNKRWPALLLFNYVRNTQAHPVVTAGPGGADLLLPNDEGDGFWAEVQLGKTAERGDTQFGYTFIRIEKDAVLTPFNASDIGFQSDSRIHRFQAADPRVVIALTGFISQRVNGLFGPFAPTPPGSLDRTLTRLQLDTIFRF